MNFFQLPRFWYDHSWLTERDSLLSYLQQDRQAYGIDFSACEWIDLHPLVDLLLQLSRTRLRGIRIKLIFKPNSNLPSRQALGFLLNAGFIDSLCDTFEHAPGSVVCLLEDTPYTLELFRTQLTRLPLPQRTLDYETILPCTLIDAHSLTTRADVSALCRRLKEDSLAEGRATAARIPIPLIYQAKLFFNSILPELIDNVRLHKRAEPDALCTMYLRLRRREEHFTAARRLAEPLFPQLSEFKQKTQRSWESDLFEFVLSDVGSSIQETWLAGWEEMHKDSRKRVLRLPESRKRVDGPNGDQIILEQIFQENASSLAPNEREQQGLPRNWTGLNALRQVILGADYSFSVRSGKNYVLVLSQPAGDTPGSEDSVTVRGAGRYPATDGVHYYFRFTSQSGRPLLRWASAIPDEGVGTEPEWWSDSRPSRFNRVHIASTFSIPEEAKGGDVLVCRVHHAEDKSRLFNFLRTCEQRKLHPVFFEIPPAIALWLYQMIRHLVPAQVNLICPIVTNDYRVAVVSEDWRPALASFLGRSSTPANTYWWRDAEAPAKSVAELARCMRQHDSLMIWDAIQRIPGAMLPASVRWSEGRLLIGGYLQFQLALRSVNVQKTIRKRLVCLLHSLRLSRIVPSTERLSNLADLVTKNLDTTSASNDSVAVLDGVRVTGSTLRAAVARWSEHADAVEIPVFQYPPDKILESQATETSLAPSSIRALEWIPDNSIVDLDSSTPRFSRLGRSEQIREKPDRSLFIPSRKSPAASYDSWQRNALLELGHYSYGRNHYFLWFDLLRFLTYQTSDAQEMFDSMLKTLREWQPDWIFYVPHDVTDTLIARLQTHATGRSTYEFPTDRVWPITALESFRATYLGQRDNLFDESDFQIETAVLIDDAMVTGRTIRYGTARLRDLGFETIYSMVILDRGDPRTCLPGLRDSKRDHFAWWSVGIGSVGARSSCPICRGVRTLRMLASNTQAVEIRRGLQSWATRWSRSDHLERFQSSIRDEPLTKALSKRLGSPRLQLVELRSSVAACTWALDLSHRREYYDYLLTRFDDFPAGARSEALAGLLLLHWDHLDEAPRTDLLKLLLTSFWSEQRRSARSLISIALLSLERTSCERALSEFTARACDQGIPTFDAALLGYALAAANAEAEADCRKVIFSWRQPSAAKSQSPEQLRRTDALVNTLGAARDERNKDIFALQLLGIPGRGVQHRSLYDVLGQISNHADGLVADSDEILLARTYLEPIRDALGRHYDLFADSDSLSQLDDALKSFSKLLSEFDRPSKAPPRSEPLAQVAQQLLNYLSIGFSDDRPSFRRLLSLELLHYLPYTVRELIKSSATAHDSDDALRKTDFVVTLKSTTTEELLLNDVGLSDSERRKLLESLHSLDVVPIPRAQLHAVLSDNLQDVEHPRRLRLGLDGGKRAPYMRITFRLQENGEALDSSYTISFENRCTEDHFKAARAGRSWFFTKTIVTALGGKSSVRLRQGELRKELTFPVLRRVKSEEAPQ